jgi:hypothetical protein
MADHLLTLGHLGRWLAHAGVPFEIGELALQAVKAAMMSGTSVWHELRNAQQFP